MLEYNEHPITSSQRRCIYMNDVKKRVSVDICGNSLTLITDESEDFVSLVAETLDSKMKSLTKNNFRISSLDAALLCAIDATGDRLKSEKRIRNLEAQLALYESNIAALREQLEALSDSAADTAADEPQSAPAETFGRELGKVSGAVSHEDKIKALEKYLENKKNTPSVSNAKTREEKIKYIESLLRGNGSGND